MKKEAIFPVFSILFGLCISVVPRLLVCDGCLSMGMRCAISVKVELVVGLFIIVLALLSFCLASHAVKLGVSIALLCFGIFSFLVSTFLIGFCDGTCANAMCECNPFTTIIMAVISALVIINEGIHAAALCKTIK